MRVMGSEQDFISVWEVVSGSAEVLGCCAVWGQGSTHCGGLLGTKHCCHPGCFSPVHTCQPLSAFLQARNFKVIAFLSRNALVVENLQ